MANAKHSAQDVNDGIHIMHAFVFADDTARLAASVTGTDIGKVAKQTDSGSFYILTDDDPLLWVLIATSGSATVPHAPTHLSGAADEIDGDKVDIDFEPSNYTPDTTPSEVTDVNELGAHLAGIDIALTSTLHAATHLSGASDEIDADKLDVDFEPSNYTPITTPSEVDDINELSAHLAGIDVALTATLHAATHLSGASDEIDADRLDIDFEPVSYTPDTAPSQVTDINELGAHLAGIDGTLTASHAVRHNPGGVDALATATASANPPGSTNSEGTSAAFPRADHTHQLTTFGNTTGTFAEGNDSRLSDSRTPLAHATTHLSGASDEIDGDKVDIDFEPSNYVPITTPAEVDDINELSAHLAGIDVALTSTLHAPTHLSGGSDELIAYQLSSGVTGSGKLMETDGSGSWALIDTPTGMTDHGALTGLEDDDHVQYVLKDGTRAMSGNLDMGSFSVTNVNLVDGVDVSAHASRHLSGAADEIDGDKVDIDFEPSNYTPSTTPAEVDDINELSAHLAGIDVALTSTLHAATHVSGASDEIDADRLDIDFEPSNYVPITTPSEVTDINELSAHLAGIDVAITSTLHAPTHLSGGSDELIAYQLSSGVTGSGKVMETDGAGGWALIDTPTGITDHGALTGLSDDDHVQYILKDGTRAMSGNLDMGSFSVTNVNLVDGVDVSAHASRHISGAADEVDADKLDIDFEPSNYTPDTTPSEVTDINELSAHLAGIDIALTSTLHASTHISGASDEIDGDRVDIDFNPSNYTPSTTPSEVSDINELSAHLAGIDVALTSTLHAATHISGASDEIDGDRVDIDFEPSNYTPITTPSEVTDVNELSAHLAGIDVAITSTLHAATHLSGGSDELIAYQLSSGVTGSGKVMETDGTGGWVLITTPTGVTDHGALTGLTDDDHTQYVLKDGTRAMSGNLDMGSFSVTNVNLVDGVDVSAHASRHLSGAADEIDGDKVDIDFEPSNYTPITTPAEVDDINELSAHLAGIDVALTSTLHAATHLSGASDEIDGDKIDIDFEPTNYTPDTTPSEVTDINELSAHLAGINIALTSTLHAATHLSGASDEIDADKLDVDFEPSNYTPITTPAEVDDINELSAHLAGIDVALTSTLHATTHLSGASDEIDGDKVDIDFEPTNYVPITTPAEVDDINELSAHLAGIDVALTSTLHASTHLSGGSDELIAYQLSSGVTGSGKLMETDGTGGWVLITTPTGLSAHASTHLSGASDEIDADRLDIDFEPSNYVPTTDPSEVTDINELSAHLAGIDVAITATLHAATHISGASDEIDGDKIDIDFEPTNYTPITTPSEVTDVNELTAHLAGIDVAITATLHASTHLSGGSDELIAYQLSSGVTGSGKIMETDGTGGWVLITTPTGGAGGGTQMADFDPNTATYPASSSAAATSSNEHPLIAFDDTANENVVFHRVLSNDYDNASDLFLDIDWRAASATASDVVWGIEVEVVGAGSDITVDSYDTQVSGTSTAGSASLVRKTFTLANGDIGGIAAGQGFRLRVQRVSDDGADDMSGDAHLRWINMRQ